MIWAIKVVQEAGLDVVKTEIHPDGRIVLYHQLEPIPEELEETFEEWRERTALEASVNARVHAEFEAKHQGPGKEILRAKLEGSLAKHREDSRLRQEERREERKEAKRQLPEVCTPKMLADIWGCSTRHVRKLARSGELRSFTIGKQMIRIKREDAEAFQSRHGPAILEPEATAVEPTIASPSKRVRAKPLSSRSEAPSRSSRPSRTREE
ncbi:helix-turn-helix domain-containing protein [Aureimonas sp. AU20]|uniref:helix-turn-helix domain-containing protein n=1 Tax=Aureimonas sp. AU20 TaxID=1349819 RepID=UPI0016510C1E|nr:helix-turn-helix domain-containing protein [Aureimonas sp. AU20]